MSEDQDAIDREKMIIHELVDEEHTHDLDADAEIEIESNIDDLFAMLEWDPSIVLTMAKSTMAVAAISNLVNAMVQDKGDPPPIAVQLQEVLFIHGLMSMRLLGPDEIADLTWWGHAAGVDAETMFAASAPDLVGAVAEICDAMGVHKDDEEVDEDDDGDAESEVEAVS